MRIYTAAALLTGIATVALAQSPQIDNDGTASLKATLDQLGVKYSQVVKYLPLTEEDIKRIPPGLLDPEAFRHGMCALDAHGQKGINLEKIATLPFTHLILERTDVRDLSPLRHMRLNQLGLRATPVSNLKPITGQPLYEIDVRETFVTDISPLRGMPMQRLDLSFTSVSNVDVIATLPHLNTLYLSYTLVSDLKPLLTAKQLRRLYLPDSIENQASLLKEMTWLTHLAYGDSDFLPVDEFWRRFDAGELKPSPRKWTPKTEQPH